MPEKKEKDGAEAAKELHPKTPEVAPDLNEAMIAESEAELATEKDSAKSELAALQQLLSDSKEDMSEEDRNAIQAEINQLAGDIGIMKDEETVASSPVKTEGSGKIQEAARVETKKPVDEKYRDALVVHAKEDILRRGYQIDESTGPFKSFGPRERFFIQKVADSLGRELVIKISTPEEGPRMAVEKEERIIRAVDSAYREAIKDGVRLGVEFPVLVDAWQEGATRGIATEFVADDKEKKRSLSSEDRFRVLSKAIEGLRALNVSEALAEAGQESLDGGAHAKRAENFLREIGDASIPPAEQLRILEAFRSHADLLDSLPMVASHGDLHGDNLAYKRDASGEETVTIMDLEMLRPTNAYYDLATTANLSSYARFFAAHKEAFRPIAKQLADSWLDEKSIGMDEYVESEIIAKDVHGADAENAYRLMRIQHALEKMSGVKGDDPIETLSREASLRIVREQLEKMDRK